jgi:hypothetical protein
MAGRERFFSYHLRFTIIFMTYKLIKINHSYAFPQSAAADYFVKRETKDEKREK